MKQKITDYLDEIYGGTFTATHLQKLVTRLESAKRLITQRRKKHWDESDVVLITYADQFHSNDLKPLTSDAKRISITPKLSSLARAANRTRIIRAGAASVLKKPVGNC